jgi:hypothetical protein
MPPTQVLQNRAEAPHRNPNFTSASSTALLPPLPTAAFGARIEVVAPPVEALPPRYPDTTLSRAWMTWVAEITDRNTHHPPTHLDWYFPFSGACSEGLRHQVGAPPTRMRSSDRQPPIGQRMLRSIVMLLARGRIGRPSSTSRRNKPTRTT